MSDARHSPIPQDRVNENLDIRGDAGRSKQEQRLHERHLAREAGRDDGPGSVESEEQPGIPDRPAGPAEGGD